MPLLLTVQCASRIGTLLNGQVGAAFLATFTMLVFLTNPSFLPVFQGRRIDGIP